MDCLEDPPYGRGSGILIGDVLLLRPSERGEDVTGDGIVILLPLRSGSYARSIGRECGGIAGTRWRLDMGDAVLTANPCAGVGLPLTVVVLIQLDDAGAARLGRRSHWNEEERRLAEKESKREGSQRKEPENSLRRSRREGAHRGRSTRELAEKESKGESSLRRSTEGLAEKES